MKNRILLFSVIIKSMILLGLLLLTLVFINSLFTNNKTQKKEISQEVTLATIDITDMFSGQIRKVRWNNKEIAVLLRQFPQKLLEADKPFEEKLHPSINKQTRSKIDNYFVYFNLGDSNNCPLFYSAGEFKDVCSANKFDEAGRAFNSTTSSFTLKVPPHYFDKNELVIGKWQP